jgi:hypothetical protein
MNWGATSAPHTPPTVQATLHLGVGDGFKAHGSKYHLAAFLALPPYSLGGVRGTFGSPIFSLLPASLKRCPLY